MEILHLFAATIIDFALFEIIFWIFIIVQQTNETAGKVVFCTGILLCIAILVLCVITPLIPQYATIGQSLVLIRSGSLFVSFTLLFRPSYTIPINKIEKVEKISKERCWRRALPVISCNWNDMIVIRTERRNYYIPIENSDEFIMELKSRIGGI